MEVILRQDVEHLGKQGDVVRVSDGYARNYLLPQRLAYRFTEGVRRQVETEARAMAARAVREEEQATAFADRLRDLQVIRFKRRAGETGTLYGSVTNIDVAAALAEHDIEIDRRNIRLEDAIKTVGTHRVTVHLYKDVDVELAVEVEPDAEGSGD